MVRVRRFDTGELTTAALCPGCWNDPVRRAALLAKLAAMGVAPVHRADLADGRYLAGREHAPGCPYHPEPHWRRFARALKRKRD